MVVALGKRQLKRDNLNKVVPFFINGKHQKTQKVFMDNLIKLFNKTGNALQSEHVNNHELVFGKLQAPEWSMYCVPNIYYISDIHLEHRLY